MKNTIGTRIAELRKASGEKQDELAEVLGCNRGSLANYETGKRTPDIETIIKIAQHYETTTDYILGVTDNKTVDTTVQAISDYTGLSDNSIEVLRLLKEWKEVKNKLESVTGSKKHEPLYFDTGDYYDTCGFSSYKLLPHETDVYEIDFIDWYIGKMNRFYHVLEKIIRLVEMSHLTNSLHHADANDMENIIKEKSPEIAKMIFSTGTIVTGIEYRDFIINECEKEYGKLLENFVAKYSHFFEKDISDEEFEKRYGSYFDLAAQLRSDTYLYEQIIEETKDGDT